MSWQAQLRQRKIPTALESIRKLTLIQNLVVVLHVQMSSEIFSVFPLTEICWNIDYKNRLKKQFLSKFLQSKGAGKLSKLELSQITAAVS